jgi:amino acid transporter
MSVKKTVIRFHMIAAMIWVLAFIAFLMLGYSQIVQFPSDIALSAHSMALLGFVNLGIRNDDSKKQKHAIVLSLLSVVGAAGVLFGGSYLIFLENLDVFAYLCILFGAVSIPLRLKEVLTIAKAQRT